MSVASLAQQCTAYVVNNITTDVLTIPSIPAEICQQIITFLLRDRRLKRKDVGYLSVYWATILNKLFTSSNSPQFLDFSSSTINGDHLGIIGQYCPNLTGLNLSGNKLLSSDSISKIANLASLKYLNLSKCPLVDSNCLVALCSKKSFDLSSLALEKCEITDQGLNAVVTAFPNLTSFILAHCTQISDNSVCKLADTCTKLEVLSLKMCRRVSDKSVSKIFSQLTELRSINLENCQRITDNSFTNFACPNLAHLNINFCDRVTPSSLLRVSSVAKHLETARVQQISIKPETTAEMGEFISRCKNVKKINVVGNVHSTALDILGKLGSCVDVKSLSVGSNDWTVQPGVASPLSPEILDSVFKPIGHLEKLLFAGIPVNAEIITAVAKFCPHLKHLVLRWVSGFNDDALRAVANGFPELERFTVTSSTTITNEAVSDLCAKCPKISELRLISCPLISDASVVEIAKLKFLERLILSDSHITNEAIKSIVKCENLRELDLSGCGSLSPPAVALLTTPPPNSTGVSKLDRFSWENMLWMTDEHVSMIIEAFPLLNQLFLSGCPGVRGNVAVKDMDLVISLEHKNVQLSMSV